MDLNVNMIHYIKEDKDKSLTNHIPWHLAPGIRSHLETIKNSNKKNSLTKNHTTKEAWDHLIDILEMDDDKGISFNEMKRLKNWFEKHQNAKKTKQYELYGGDIMYNWVNNQLNSARLKVKQKKEAEKTMGKDNAYRKTHKTDRQTNVTKLDNTPTYNPMTGNKLNRLKELSAIQESKVIIINEKQEKIIKKLFINNNII